MADVQPWSRRTSETSKAYEAFVAYRDMGAERTLRAVGEVLGKSHAVLSVWSSKHDWVSRSAAWDSIPGDSVANAYADMAAEIAADHKRVATKLLLRLEKGMDALAEGAAPSQTWTLAHGAARQGHNYATDLVKPASTATDEINKAIENLLNKLAGE